MAIVEKFGPLLGRVLMALLFVPAGVSKLTGFAGTVGYIKSVGLPLPEVGAAIAVIVELGVGLALLVGYKARYAALVLALFTVAAAIGFHNFWAMEEAKVMINRIQFFKNLSIAGGLLFIAAYGAGPFALDNRTKD
ncbi:DoxX family protein [Ferrovibrio sp.]|uniref:DoxX family protein n=1 Tax=Ferrovibrio sp. TaxID=1917215 RepID=UPI001B4DB81F|nr:DoxX family protein [Ferrovibrio sp.]MBP7062612.1 DoxX family protein [Ferrovibrio sp.]